MGRTRKGERSIVSNVVVSAVIVGIICIVLLYEPQNSAALHTQTPRVIAFADSKDWVTELHKVSRIRFERKRRTDPAEEMVGDREVQALGPLDEENKFKVFIEIGQVIDRLSSEAIKASEKAQQTGEIRHFVDAMESSYYQSKAIVALQLLANDQYWTLVEGNSSPPLPEGYVSIAWGGVAKVEEQPALVFFPIDLGEHAGVSGFLDAFAGAERVYVRDEVQAFNQLAFPERRRRINAHIDASQILGDRETRQALTSTELESNLGSLFDNRIRYELEDFTLAVGSLHADRPRL